MDFVEHLDTGVLGHDVVVREEHLLHQVVYRLVQEALSINQRISFELEANYRTHIAAASRNIWIGFLAGPGP